jgi:hypothetical protein
MTGRLSLDELEAFARERSGEDLVAIARRVERTGGCAQPVRLKSTGPDSLSKGEPDGVLLVACKSRRETRCPPCANTYRGDARQIVRAGIEGGKGVPESVSSHAAVFLTLTAPSFGAVHRSTDGPCNAGPPGNCRHGRSRHCLARHERNDVLVGSPLCPDCYDYESAVMFNASVGELWRRVTIYARRHLAYCLDLPEREIKSLVRLSYLKVAELQHRGVIHLHAIVRADAATDEVCPPPIPISTALLTEALLRATRAVFVERVVNGEILRFVFGEQVKVDSLARGEVKGIASYLAKYLTKEASGNGALDHRLREGEIEYLELPDHLRRIVETAWSLGADPELGRLRRWAHALGYTGHLMTKSRRYSTTFLRLRAARQAWRLAEGGATEDASPAPKLHWSFEGSGHRCRIDAVLAGTFARDRRMAARERWEESNAYWPADRGDADV